jgi:UDP-glucose 4-epimerase
VQLFTRFEREFPRNFRFEGSDLKALVTGGAGFIGRHLVAALRQDGHEVIMLDNLHNANYKVQPPEDVRFVLADIRDRSALLSSFKGVDVVYHLAAQSNVLESVADSDYSFTTNVSGTYNVLSAAQRSGVHRVVFTSSREVYGDTDLLPVSEDHVLNPKNPYGASKVAGEVYCRTFYATYGLDVGVLRLSNVYGPGDHGRIIPLWIECARTGQELELYGGRQILDFVPVRLVVQALQRAATVPLEMQPVNIASGAGTSLHDLATRIEQLPGSRVHLRVLPARPVETLRFTASVVRMGKLLHILPPADPLCDLNTLWGDVGAAPT